MKRMIYKGTYQSRQLKPFKWLRSLLTKHWYLHFEQNMLLGKLYFIFQISRSDWLFLKICIARCCLMLISPFEKKIFNGDLCRDLHTLLSSLLQGLTWCLFGNKPSPDMLTSSNANIFHVTGPLYGEFTGQQWSFDVFFDLHLNKWLSKQWWGWWFEMQLCSLWYHRNEPVMTKILHTKPGIPGGGKLIFTVVIHKWRLALCQLVHARTIDKYDITSSQKRPSLETMS